MPALVTEPALHLQDAVHGLAVDEEPVAVAQDGPETAVAEGGVLADELLDPRGEEAIRGRFLLGSRPAPAHGTAGHGEETTDTAFRGVGEHLSHSSDVSRSKGRLILCLLQDVHVEHQLAHLLFQLLDLLVLLGFFIPGPGAERILRAREELLPPVFYFGHGETVLAGRLLHRGLTPNDADDQC